MSHHIVPLKTNIATLMILIALTAITVITAKFVHLGGGGNLILAMAIASVKATVVFGWFMHLKYEGMMNRVIAVCGLGFLFLFFGLSYVDLFFRDFTYW
jgi:cytochrome c oxidase subunit 4